jgi:hypothetical protein
MTLGNASYTRQNIVRNFYDSVEKETTRRTRADASEMRVCARLDAPNNSLRQRLLMMTLQLSDRQPSVNYRIHVVQAQD